MARPKPTVIKALKHNIPTNSKLLLAVSGGGDSVALLHGCYSLRKKLQIEIEVAHLDHGLRNSSKRDAEFVKELVLSLGLKYHGKSLKKPENKINLEEWGRKERYKFFNSLLEKRGLDFVVTAHTADDVAETFLIRLLSNKELKSIEAIGEQGCRLRPLLMVTKQQIYDYLQREQLSYVEDETNKDTSFLRNRIRHNLIPLLASEYDRRIVETLAERAFNTAEDIAYLYRVIQPINELISKHTFGNKSWLRTARLELVKLSDVLAWRLVELLFKPKLGFNLGRSHSEAALRVLSGEAVAAQLPTGWRLQLKNGGIALSRINRE